MKKNLFIIVAAVILIGIAAVLFMTLTKKNVEKMETSKETVVLLQTSLGNITLSCTTKRIYIGTTL